MIFQLQQLSLSSSLEYVCEEPMLVSIQEPLQDPLQQSLQVLQKETLFELEHIEVPQQKCFGNPFLESAHKPLLESMCQ